MSGSHWEIVNDNRDVASNTAIDLWDNSLLYFNWCDENPIKITKTINVGKDAGKEYTLKYPRMYTIKGLCLHCNIVEEYLKDIRNSKDKSSDYYVVVSKIMYIIYTQNIEYAAIDVFNSGFIGKVLNIDKEEKPSGIIKIEVVHGLPELSESEDEILKKLESENDLFGKE